MTINYFQPTTYILYTFFSHQKSLIKIYRNISQEKHGELISGVYQTIGTKDYIHSWETEHVVFNQDTILE